MNNKAYISYSVICVLLLIGFVTLSLRATTTVSTLAKNGSSSKPTIIIDAGHGGEDGGAVSPSNLMEKDINLDIAKTLEKLFLQGGFKVVLTRTTDKSIHDDNATTLREKKVSDIHNRVKICNNSENNILISIHQNKFEQSEYSGTQVFYSTNDSRSAELAEYIKVAVKGLLQNENKRECKAATSSIYLLDNAQVPAVLVECGFLSNPKEEKLLRTDEYKNSIAFSIYSGFLEFYYQNY